jgi:hypothetical protein
MTVSTVFPVANYSGQQTCTPVTISDVATQLGFALDRSSGTLWSQAGMTATCLVQISLDGGTTWTDYFSVVAHARDTNNSKDVGVNKTSGQPSTLPDGAGRQVRVTLTVSIGLVHTSGTLTWQ